MQQMLLTKISLACLCLTKNNLGVKAKLLELRVFFVFFVRVYLQLVVIVYSFLLLYCLLSFWCHHRCIMLRNLSSFLV